MVENSRPRRRATITRNNYREPDSDSDFDLPSSKRSLPSRTSRRIQNYNENSDTDPDVSTTSSESEGNIVGALRSQLPSSVSQKSTVRNLRSSKRKRGADRRNAQSSSFQTYKRRKVTINATSDQKIEAPVPSVNAFVPPPPSGNIPAWQNLEYQILFKIMKYASHPLYYGSSRDTGSTRWLLETSELCSSFHDACIGALMYSPPLLPSPRAHWLLNLLRASARQFSPTEDERSSRRTLSMDYRKTIKRLDIEVKHLLIKKRGIDLEELLTYTPLLSELRLYHNHDEMGSAFIWAQPRYSKDKWTYGQLFDQLDSHNLRIKSFEWNGRFLKDDPSLKSLTRAHMQTCLNGLRKVDFLNLSVINVEKETERLADCRNALIDSLGTLLELEELSFQSCNILDSDTLTKLPLNLRRISLRQCPHITSEGLQEYLVMGGSTLTTLELLGNQVLDMGFMSGLKQMCPRLRYLTVDLNFSDPTSYRDTDPLFDELLPNGAPTWPGSLISINLGPLRSLSAEDAEAFYMSLADAANNLPDLRTLVLKTLLKDISWRDRAKMRTKWLGLFEDIFLVRRSSETMSKPAALPLIRTTVQLDTENESTGKRKSARLRDLEDLNISESQKAEESDTSVSAGEKRDRQSRCNVVIFELSDQRPAQDQYTERDFLDDEPSDDGDWNGRDQTTSVYSSRHYGW